MVSLPTRGMSRRLTASSATRRTVQRAQPSGGSLHTMANNPLFLILIERSGGAGPLLLKQCGFQAAALVTARNDDRLSEWPAE